MAKTISNPINIDQEIAEKQKIYKEVLRQDFPPSLMEKLKIVGSNGINRKRLYFKPANHYRRIQTGLSRSRHIYKGGWFYQYGEATCCLWAIVNALSVLGSNPIGTCLSQIYNRSQKQNQLGMKGMSLLELSSIIKKYPQMGIEMELLIGEKDIKPLVKPKSSDPTSSPSSRINHNASVIKKALDQNKILLTTVASNRYLGVDRRNFEENVITGLFEPLHAICIVGYRVNDKGHMDLQIIDSERGNIWVHLEHLSKSIKPYHTYLIKAKELIPNR